MSSNLPPMPFGTSEDLEERGSGDFKYRAETPVVLDREGFEEETAADVQKYMTETHGFGWENLPQELAEYGAEHLITWLVENGWEDRTVKDVGVLLGVLHEDGSWV